MKIVTDKRDNGILLEVSGRMDAVTSSEFEKAALNVINDGEKMIVVDLSDLEYISSAGLRSILVSAKKQKSVGGVMQFCGLTGMVEEVFSVSGLINMFKVSSTVDEAFGV